MPTLKDATIESLEAAVVLLQARPTQRPTTGPAILAEIARVAAVASLLAEIDGTIAELRSGFDALAEDLCRAVPYSDIAPVSTIAIPGLPAMVPRWPKNRTKWENALLREHALKAARDSIEPEAVDPETGTRVPSWDQAVASIERVWSFLGGNAKTSGIKALGLVPGDYCHEEKAPPTIQVVR